MTSSEFINKWFGVSDGKSRTLSSIYKDANGTIYSYGHHYPLLFKVGSLTFRNTSGYSATTGKHINWAGSLADFDVQVSGCNPYTWRNSTEFEKLPNLLSLLNYDYEPKARENIEQRIIKAVLKDLEAERSEVQAEMAKKKRFDTQVYANLQQRNLTLTSAIAHVKAEL